MNEWALIQQIQHKIPRLLQGEIGIGDDGDWMPFPQGKGICAVSDALVEGVDFLFKEASPSAVGHKALAINLSDLAAMGATPVAFTVALGIPKTINSPWIFRFYDGLLRLAKKHHVRCLGGDVSSSKQFFASITALGSLSTGAAVMRSQAQCGDLIGVSGTLGGSILGKHLRFEPRLLLSQLLVKRFRPSAMIDISDGFWQDLERVLQASKVKARINLEAIPVSKEAFCLAKGDRQKAISHALTDGEDFELLFTIDSKKQSALSQAWRDQFPRLPLTWVGAIQRGKPSVEWFQNGKKILAPRVSQKGYQHFR